MSSTRPLSGLTVIEIGHSVAAPYAGMILGELGAEVIKVENPRTGDAARGSLTVQGVANVLRLPCRQLSWLVVGEIAEDVTQDADVTSGPPRLQKRVARPK